MIEDPTPKQAIDASNMTLREIAARASCDIATVWRSGKTGEWPRNPRVRRMLRAALGLTTTTEVKL